MNQGKTQAIRKIAKDLKGYIFFYPQYIVDSMDLGKRTTFAGYVDEANKALRIGRADCSHLDIYDKNMGKIVAAGRADTDPVAVVPLENLEGIHKIFNETCHNVYNARPYKIAPPVKPSMDFKGWIKMDRKPKETITQETA